MVSFSNSSRMGQIKLEQLIGIKKNKFVNLLLSFNLSKKNLYVRKGL